MLRAASLSCFALLVSLVSGACANTLDGDGDEEDGGGSSQNSNSCEAKEDAAGVPVTVRFANNSSTEIYVWTACDTPDRPEFVFSREGAEVSIDKVPCSGTCGQAQTDEDPYCPVQDCERGKLVRIDAGHAYDFEWSATEQELSSMKEDCYDSSKVIASSCWRQIDLEGSLEASGAYYLQSQLQHSSNPSNVYGCPCALAADTDGVCEVDLVSCQITGSEVYFDKVPVTLPGDEVIELTASGS